MKIANIRIDFLVNSLIGKMKPKAHQPTYAIQYEDNLKYAAWLAGES